MIGKEIIQHVMEHGFDIALLDPAIKVAAGAARDEIAKLLGPKWTENLEDLIKRFARKTEGKKTEAPPLSVSLPLLEVARDESNEVLQDMWASLLAAASDPTRRLYRREFVEIAKKLDPLDVLVLPILANGGELAPSRIEFISTQLDAPKDQVELSFRNLNMLELTFPKAINQPRQQPVLTALGRQFLAAVSY